MARRAAVLTLSLVVALAAPIATATPAAMDVVGPSQRRPPPPVGAPVAPPVGPPREPHHRHTAAREPRAGDVAPVDWRAPASDGAIEGYADRTSVLPGQAVRLYVSTAARSYVVRTFRMGWYGGRLGVQVWRSDALRGRPQGPPVQVAAQTNTWAARWRPSLRIDTTGWRPGDYLLRLDAGDGAKSYVPLTVRTRSARGRVVLINAVTTWQAYNTWGGPDLYLGPDGRFAGRSRAVSFDRPYALGNGAGFFVRNELPIVAQAERLGLRLDWVTDADLQHYPHLLDGAAAVVSLGHDEYWSPRMRAALTRARDRGTNLAFFGANAVYRRIRFAATALGPDRLETNYKVARQDPLYGREDRRVTADWPAAPDPRPESSLIGEQYRCATVGGKAPGVVAAAGAWLFAGTPVRDGTRLPGLIGPEVDAVDPHVPTPHPIAVLMHSPVGCETGPSYADAAYYVARGGAGVFDAGTIGWSCAFARCRASGITARVVRQVTANVLRAFARPRAGLRHPVTITGNPPEAARNTTAGGATKR